MKFVRRYGQLLAFLLVVVVSIVALYKVQNGAITRERDAQLVACERVQILRDQANGVSVLIYKVYSDGAKREKSLIKGDPENAGKHRKSFKAIDTQRKRLVITGPTDCNLAINKPKVYKPPAPEFIYKDGPRVKIAEKRAEAIIKKAKTGTSIASPLPNG